MAHLGYNIKDLAEAQRAQYLKMSFGGFAVNSYKLLVRFRNC